MLRPVEVRALPGYRLWLRYEDGVEGEVDLSHLAGKGVFACWEEAGAFEAVRLDGGAVAWGAGVDLCGDALYLQITGQAPETVFPNLTPQRTHA